MIVALVAGGAEFVLQQHRILQGNALSLLEGVCGYIAGVFVLQYGSFRKRLNRIVDLFERVEEGDFTEPYDTAADGRPDVVTQVGRVYNRVRVQLSTMVQTDPLTNCMNRRGFEQALAR